MFKLKKRKGGTLVLIIGVSFFCLAMSAIVTMLLLSNTLNARKQREITQAYYLTLAGLEMGSSVVLKRDINDDFTVLEAFASTTDTSYRNNIFEDKIVFGPCHPSDKNSPSSPCNKGDCPPECAAFHGGKSCLAPDTIACYNSSFIELKIYAVYQDGTRVKPGPLSGPVWVEIYAKGTYLNNAGVETSHAGTIRYLTTEPERFIREVANPNSF